MGKARGDPGAGQGGDGLRKSPGNIQNAKQRAFASVVWAATAGTLLFLGSDGTEETV